MVKLKGPVASLDASGKLADVLVFAKTKGRRYAKKLTNPTNPRSGDQVGSRAMIRFLSKQWQNLTPTMRDTYADLAEAAKTTPYHAYLSANQKRWTTGLYPAMEWPPNLGVNAGLISFATHDVHGFSVEFTLIPQTANYNWGVIAYTNPTLPYTGSIATALSVDPWDCVSNLVISYGPLSIGTHYFRFYTFSYEGKPDTTFFMTPNVVITG